MAETPAWPAVSMEETFRILTAPGAPFEMETVTALGRSVRVYKNARANIRTIFDDAWNHGDRTFIVYDEERLTYDHHNRAASALARVLTEKYGVKKGDRVAIAMRNLPEWFISFWAAIAIGAVVTPLNAWGTGEDLTYGITDSKAKVAFVDAERLDRLQPHIKELGLSGLVAVRTPKEQLKNADAFEALIGPPSEYGKLPNTPPPNPGIQPEDDATILYTSGTTGKPKGALGTHRNCMTNLVSLGFGAARAEVRRTGKLPVPIVPAPDAPQGATLLPVPLFHVTGSHSVMIPAMAAGSKLVLMHRWNPEKALELIERERCTGMSAVPTMVWQLLESPDWGKRDISSMAGLGYGGAAASPELTARAKAAFPDSYPGQGYGATETSSVAVSNSGEDYMARPTSVGTRVPVDDIRIEDENGNVLPVGGVGEICIYGPNVVKGYWNKPEASAKAFQNGWYHTGDVGRIDEEGFIFLMDRIKDMLIRGGENIYCVEIEDALYTHPAVMDAAVMGIPHRVLGEEPAAVVRVKPGMSVGEAELQGHLRGRLAAFKVPVLIDVRTEELPRNANGKTLKSVMREELAAKAGPRG